MQPLLADDDLEHGNRAGRQVAHVKAGAKKPDGLLQRLNNRSNVKVMMRVWEPRLEFVVRLMLVATFLDDSFRIATQFSEHTKNIGEEGCLWWLMATSPTLVRVIATVALSIGLLAQSLGSLSLLALRHPDGATKALIGWAIAQPVLYHELSNVEFVAESLSLVGGLLMLRAHLVAEPFTQLLGRLLLPAMYLYHAGIFLFSAFTYDVNKTYAAYIASLSIFVVHIAVLVGLVIGSMLVAVGLKSRVIAFSLALSNLCIVCYQHPFFRFLWIEGGKWKYDEQNMLVNVPLPTGISLSDLDPSQIYDLHRYYFFLGLSTSGALLLLAQFGPGEIAVQKNEVLLPIQARAQD